MKNIVVFMLSLWGVLVVRAENPVRLTVEMENSGEVQMFCMNYADPVPGAEFLENVVTEKKDGKYFYSFPDDGNIYVCFVNFENSKHLYHNFKLVIFPEETLEVKGTLYENYTDYTVNGSEVYDEFCRHRPSYLEYEKEIFAKNLDGCDPETFEDEVRYAEYQSLWANIHNEMLDFITKNPSHPLAALYYCYALDEDHVKIYDMITGRAKEGYYKQFMDYQYRNYELWKSFEE